MLKNEVYAANLLLPKYELVIFTWGNVSGIDRETNTVVIKPSGAEYDTMSAAEMVALTLDGKVANGELKPSSDTPAHLELYKAYAQIGGICHTHSRYATVFAQACMPIPVFGTTHADYFNGTIPVARELTEAEINGDYEKATGRAIIDTNFDPAEIPAVLVPSHGVFTFGKTPLAAVENAKILEEVALMAFHTLMLKRDISPLGGTLLHKHYCRKHGKNAYYGQ
ncbi:MAG: L-ribulose-5-phosphate 4-epimerase AraD [Planctomycetota bacterium]|jgi:L-ribulose-5-phosphate 4-epimerase|nr:L-ribulose-5-phosphate 4-epimerase AraD [Planctomycetota bacterium]